jgi:hypothetical protein
MKTAMLFFALLLSFACNKKPEPLSIQPTDKPMQPTANLNEQFQLKIGQTATLNDGFTITFESVPNDSRCPRRVECAWAGNATVVLKFTDGTDTLNSISSIPIAHGPYVIKMDSLSPYPDYPGTIAQDAYVVALVVTNK